MCLAGRNPSVVSPAIKAANRPVKYENLANFKKTPGRNRSRNPFVCGTFFQGGPERKPEVTNAVRGARTALNKAKAPQPSFVEKCRKKHNRSCIPIAIKEQST